MFERARRARDADRSRIAPTLGYVGRNVGDQPYIMDLVYQDHFAGFVASSFVAPWQSHLVGSGSGLYSSYPTVMIVNAGTTLSSSRIVDWVSSSTMEQMMAGYQRDASLRARVLFSSVDAQAKLFVGFATSQNTGDVADGLFFGINGAISTSNFICTSRKSSVATTDILDGGGSRANIPVDTAWHDVAIICDSENGEVRFYVDNQLATTITTDLPSAASDVVTPHFSALNGTTAAERRISCDVIVLAEAAP